ncbi:hypothetical protein H4R34_001099 [Dimargaris verticillata]|uniref:Uncharacterized protein n=1 Tax=Dimargaris verticillata TaxID=2761393 RepID=A0A9W8B6U7_9FUNG|nr:hypothetical protein H4R34_001099 [Dimargaris verticillata]
MAGSTPHADSATYADPDFGYHLFNTVAGQQVVVSLAYIALFLLLYRTVVLLFPLTALTSVPRTVTIAAAAPRPPLVTAEPIPGAWPTAFNAHPMPEPAPLRLSPSRRDPLLGLTRSATAARTAWVASVVHETRQTSHYWAALIPRLSCALALTLVLMEVVLLFVTLWVCNYLDLAMYATTLPTTLPRTTRRASLPITWLPVFSWQDLWTTDLLTLFWHYQVVGTLVTVGIMLPFTYFFAGTDPTATFSSRCREAALVTCLVQILHGILVAVFTVGFLGLPPQLSELWLLHTWLCAVTVPSALWLISRGLAVWWATLRSLYLRLDHPQQMQLKLDVVVCHVHTLQRELDQLHWRQRRNLVQERWESAVLGSQDGLARPSSSVTIWQRLRRRRSRLAALGSLDPSATKAGSPSPSTIIQSRLGALHTEESTTNHLDDSLISTERPPASIEPKTTLRWFNAMAKPMSQHQRTKSAEAQTWNEPPRLGKRKPSGSHQQHAALKVGKLHAFPSLLGPLNNDLYATPLHRSFNSSFSSIHRRQVTPQSSSHTLAMTTAQLASAYASYRTLRGLAARRPWRWNLVFCVMFLTTTAACAALGFLSAKAAVWGVLNVEPDLGSWSCWGLDFHPVDPASHVGGLSPTMAATNQWLNLTMDYVQALGPLDDTAASTATNSLSLARAWTTAAHWYHVWWDDWTAPSNGNSNGHDARPPTTPCEPTLTLPFPFPLQATGCPREPMVDYFPSHGQVRASAPPFTSFAVPLGVINPGLPFQPPTTASKQLKHDSSKPMDNLHQEPPSPRAAFWAVSMSQWLLVAFSALLLVTGIQSLFSANIDPSSQASPGLPDSLTEAWLRAHYFHFPQLTRLDLHQGVVLVFAVLTMLHTWPTFVRLLGLVAPSVWQQASTPLGTSVWDGLASSATVQGLYGWLYALQKSLNEWYDLSDSSAPWYHVGSAMVAKGMAQLTDTLMTVGYTLWSFRGTVLVRRATMRLMGWTITLLFHVIPRWYHWVRAGWIQMWSSSDYSPNLVVGLRHGWRSLLTVWWGLMAWGTGQSSLPMGHIDPPLLTASVATAPPSEQCVPIQPPFVPSSWPTRSTEAWCPWPTIDPGVEHNSAYVFPITSSSMSFWKTSTPDPFNAFSPQSLRTPMDVTTFDPADEEDSLDDDLDQPWARYLRSRGYERRAAWAIWWEWKTTLALTLLWRSTAASALVQPAIFVALSARGGNGSSTTSFGHRFRFGTSWGRDQPASPPTTSDQEASTPLIPVPPVPPSPPPPTYYQWAFANHTLTPTTLPQQRMYHYYYHLAYYQTYYTQTMDQLMGLKQPLVYSANATDAPVDELWRQLFWDSAFAWDQPKSVWVFWWAWWSTYHHHHAPKSGQALAPFHTTDHGPKRQAATDPGFGWQFMELLFGPPDPTRTWRRWAEKTTKWSPDTLYAQTQVLMDWSHVQPDHDAHAWRHRWEAWQHAWWRPVCFARPTTTTDFAVNTGPVARAVTPAWLAPPPPCPRLPPAVAQPLLDQEPLNDHAMHPLFRLSVVLLRAGLFLLLTYQTVVRGVTVFIH